MRMMMMMTRRRRRTMMGFVQVCPTWIVLFNFVFLSAVSVLLSVRQGVSFAAEANPGALK
jgi:hypothetical protein